MSTSPSPVAPQTFQWPRGKRVAVSLTFDDARPSQIDVGMDILRRHAVPATFYVTLAPLAQRLDDWKAALAAGHEIGNHTVNHPCTGNFHWSRKHALEDYTPAMMEQELTGANQQIHALLGVTPQTFAYPCGLTFIGRGTAHQSYVPLVAKHFLAGRGFRNESTNPPAYCDLASVGGYDMDSVTADYVIDLIHAGAKAGDWTVFVGHNVGDPARQTVTADVLDKVCAYCQDPANAVWIDTACNIATYIKTSRK